MAFDPPVTVIAPLMVAEVVVMPEAAVVVSTGSVEGVTWFEAVDDALVPAAFVAVTVKVYGVPLVSPVRIAEVPVVVLETLPGDDVTV